LIRLDIDNHSITSRRLYVRKPLDGTKILFYNLYILCANVRSSAYNGPTDRPTDRPTKRTIGTDEHTRVMILYPSRDTISLCTHIHTHTSRRLNTRESLDGGAKGYT